MTRMAVPRSAYTQMNSLIISGVFLSFLPELKIEIDYRTFRAITEYGRVVQSRATTMELPEPIRRWVRTLQFNTTDLDGNPNHADNGGIVGLATNHCVGSLLNHSRRYAKCVYWPRDFISPYLTKHDGVQLMGCVFIRANRKIYRHEQLLINYEPNTAALIENMLQFV